jgi:hypothetical protein
MLLIVLSSCSHNALALNFRVRAVSKFVFLGGIFIAPLSTNGGAMVDCIVWNHHAQTGR